MIPVPKHTLKAALDLLEEKGLAGSIDSAKTYATYLSAFGPSLRINGLLATLLQHEVEGEKGKGKRGPLLDLLMQLIKDPEAKLMEAEEVKAIGNKQALQYAESLDASQRRRFQDQLERATIALKLAIRTCQLKAEPIPAKQEVAEAQIEVTNPLNTDDDE